MNKDKKDKDTKKTNEETDSTPNIPENLPLLPANMPEILLIGGNRQQGNQEQAVPLWLITFTDIMALMLTFFVLLYSMSVPELEKWQDMTEAVNEGFNRTKTLERFAGQSMDVSIEKISPGRALDLNYLATLLQQQMAQYEDMNSVVLLQSSSQLIISMPADLLFEAGRAEVDIDGKRAMYVLGGILNRIRNRIEIIGHADPRPLSSSSTYSSNWELSLARASMIAALLKEVGYQRDMIVRGLSSSRYSELEGGGEGTVKMDTARRVDIVIMKDDGTLRTVFELEELG